MLCVGDLMLDDFVYGEVSRISPEAPAPVIAVKRSEIDDRRRRQRGAQHRLARRALHLRRRGRRRRGRRLTLRKALAKLERGSSRDLVIDTARPTTRKVRFVSEHYSTHLLRADWEAAAPASAEIERQLIAHAEAALPQVGAVVLSDYAKGVLTARVIRAVIEAARKLGKPVIVDPKRPRLSRSIAARR